MSMTAAEMREHVQDMLDMDEDDCSLRVYLIQVSREPDSPEVYRYAVERVDFIPPPDDLGERWEYQAEAAIYLHEIYTHFGELDNRKLGDSFDWLCWPWD